MRLRVEGASLVLASSACAVIAQLHYVASCRVHLQAPDFEKYPCIPLAYAAGRKVRDARAA
jgi:1-deoxy-D-xylulose 5-phosphate reductoisomerase